MFNQEQDSRWAEGQTNENNERTDDLDGAAEGENETANVSALPAQTAPASRPMSRGSYYGRERDRGEPGDYHHHHGGSSSRRHRNPQGGGETQINTSASTRLRNDSFRDPGRINGGYGYGEPYYPPRQPAYGYGAPPYYMGGYGAGGGGGVGGYGVQPPGWMRNAREMLERLRVEDPVRYRQWYDQYQAHRRNPQQVPDPGMPVYPGPAAVPAYGGMPPWQHGGPYLPSGSNSMYNEPISDRGPNSEIGKPTEDSGRSSVNEELRGYNYPGMPYQNGPLLNQTPSLNQDPDNCFKSISDSRYQESPEPEPKRTTPLKFNTFHSLGVITPLGQLIRVKQGSTIEIVQIKSLLNHLPEYKEVESFPGPLIKGTTHKNTVISFCQKKIKEAFSSDNQVDKDHYILLWELLILLLRQNGNVVGSDIAELLVGNKNNASRSAEDIISDDTASTEPGGIATEGTSAAQESTTTAARHVSEAKATEKFCELLLYGHKKDALEYAMNSGLWGHALFLATKMDERTYGNVMARFANCIAFNHPLQTFYQLLSGKQPASTNSCCEESFGDWKPHLAMILSNAGARPDVEEKSLSRMGDTLASKGLVYAAQFCYLMGKEEFSSNSKLGSLLGYCNAKKNVIEATQMTEIYEFALSLAHTDFTLGINFIQSKLDYSKTLLSLGFVEQAFSYCEEMAKKINLCSLKNSDVDVSLLKWSVLQISERLVNIEESNNGVEPKWIQELRAALTAKVKYERLESTSDSASERRDSNVDNQTMIKNYEEEYRQQELEKTTDASYIQNQQQPDVIDSGSNPNEYIHYNQNPPSNEMPTSYTTTSSSSMPPQAYNPMQPPMYNPNSMNNGPSDPSSYDAGVNSNIPQYISGSSDPTTQNNPGLQPSMFGQQNTYYSPSDPYPSQPTSGVYSGDNNNYLTQNDYNHYGQPNSMSGGPSGGINTGANNVKDNDYNQPPKFSTGGGQLPRPSQEDKQNNKDKKPSKGGGGGDGKKQKPGWLGGLMNKLIKAPNQAILPDDTDPTIVWDPNLKKWVNTKEEEDSDSGPKGPPPTDFDLSRGPGSGPPGPPMMMQKPPPFQPNGPLGSMIASSGQVPQMMSMPNPMMPVPQAQPQMGHPNTMPQNPSNVPLQRPDNFLMQNQPNFLSNPGVSQPVVNGGQNGPMSNGSAVGGNKYKLPKNRNPRSGYVDILNPGGGNPNQPPVGNGNLPDGNASNVMNPSMGQPMIPNMFIPSPVSGSGDSGPISFLTPLSEGAPPISTAQNQSETN